MTPAGAKRSRRHDSPELLAASPWLGLAFGLFVLVFGFLECGDEHVNRIVGDLDRRPHIVLLGMFCLNDYTVTCCCDVELAESLLHI